MNDLPLSLFDFLHLIDEELLDRLGDLTFPLVASHIGNSLLTFFMIYFLAKWVFDILRSVGKGGKR